MNTIENIDKIPVTIKKSLFNNAGLGLFSTSKISKDTLIMCYTGFVGTHCDI